MGERHEPAVVVPQPAGALEDEGHVDGVALSVDVDGGWPRHVAAPDVIRHGAPRGRRCVRRLPPEAGVLPFKIQLTIS
ncbi:hypothetical protein DUHN55_21330 [Helicobacter pylori]